MTWPKITALLCALLGVFLISGQSATDGVSVIGILCAALSAVFYAVMVIFNKLARNISGMENSTLQLLFAVVVVTVFMLCRQGFSIRLAHPTGCPCFGSDLSTPA